MASTIRPWEYLLYPELREFEPDRRRPVLRAASESGFDTIEYVGLAIALLVTVLLTRYSATGWGLADRFGAAVANFVVAVPLLLLLAGPFYVRRTRRGLRTELRKFRDAKAGRA